MPLGGIGGIIGGGGGQSLGKAQGSITIDTSQADRAVVSMQRVGRQIEQSFGRNVMRGVDNVIGGLRSMRGEIVAIGVAAGAVTLGGFLAVDDLRKYQIQFRALLGSQKASDQAMKQIADQANRFGLNLTESLQLGRALIPVLEDGADNLDIWIARAARLNAVNPLKNTTDAIRAINEFLAGQPRTLQFVFNIPPEVIRQAKDATDDVGAQLDFILNKMGATEAAALELGGGFRGTMQTLRNELQLTLAVGFEPLLNEGVIPFLQGFREFIAELRESRPELLGVGASILAIAAVGAPTLLFLNQILGVLVKIKGLGVLAALGRLGVAGLVAGGAAFGAKAGLNAIGRATGREDLAEAGFRDIIFMAIEAFSKLAVIVDTILIRAIQGWVNQLANAIVGIGNFVTALGRILIRIGDIVPDFAGGDKIREMGQGLIDAGAGASEFAEKLRTDADTAVTNFVQNMIQGSQMFIQRAGQFLGVIERQERAPRGRGERLGGGAGPEEAQRFTDEQLAALQDYYDQVQDIEAQAAQDRADATWQYEQQRTQIIADFERMILREEEDFLRQRARQNEQLARDIERIRQEAVEQEAEWQQDLADTIADLREESAGRIEDLERDHARNMERLQKDHRLSLMEAASRLDARAVASEQRSFRNRVSQMEQDLQDRIEQERENLEERIEQEQEAHQERLDNAREADEERIRDMEEALRERQRQEDEDRRIRLERMREDHRRQLAELDRANAERMFRITQRETRERILNDIAFRRRLTSLGIHNQAWLTLQQQRQDASIRLFDRYWSEVMQQQRRMMPDPRDRNPPGGVGGFQSGGFNYRTGMAMLHGTRNRPETVLNPATTQALRLMLGNFSQRGLVSAVAGGGSSSSITVAEGAIQVFAQPGQDAEDIGLVVEGKMKELFRKLS